VTKETIRLIGVGLAMALGVGTVAVWRSKAETPRAADTTPAATTQSEARQRAPDPSPPLQVPDPPSIAPTASRISPRDDGGPADEATLMMRLREVARTDVAQAVELAEEGNRRYPDSAGAPERTAILIHALAAEGRSSEARGQAEYMVNHFEDSQWVREIEAFTGAHRHRNAHLGPSGRIEYY
jgi:hypothetical protein